MPYFSPGTRIFGNYEIDSMPLKGSMGVVYLCEDLQNHHPIALKTFRSKYLADRDTREEFINEGIRWMNLGRHPNIVSCYKVERGSDGTEIYLLLELISKQDGMKDASLRSMLSSGKTFSPELVLLFGLQITRGMGYATRIIPGLVHRDLKPENILIGKDKLPGSDCCRLRVTDFGLASVITDRLIEKNSDDATSAYDQSNPSGPIFYIAPERWNGDDYDLRSDVYSLGCIMLEMVTGKLPVNSPNIDKDEIKGTVQKI